MAAVLVHIPYTPGIEPNGLMFRPRYKRRRRPGVSLAAFLRKSRGLHRLVRCPPAPGRRPAAFPRGPAPRTSLPAASISFAQALRAAHTTRAPPCPAYWPSLSQLLTLGNGAGNARAASAAPVLAIPPPTPTALPWAMAALRPAPFGARGVVEAPPHQCPARFRALCLVCIPLSVPPTLLSALSALPACQTD